MVISDAHERRLGEAADRAGRRWAGPRSSAVPCDVTVEADVQRLSPAARRAPRPPRRGRQQRRARRHRPARRDDRRAVGARSSTSPSPGPSAAPGRPYATCWPQGRGVIVNNASVLGWRAQPGQAHYAAAKAGVMALTRCAAAEAAPAGVRVNAVSPQPGRAPVPEPGHPRRGPGRPAPPRALRPRGRDLGGGQRHRLPGQRLLLLHDRRGRLGLEPAPVSTGAPVTGTAGPRTPGPTCAGAPSPALVADVAERRRRRRGGGRRGLAADLWRTGRGGRAGSPGRLHGRRASSPGDRVAHLGARTAPSGWSPPSGRSGPGPSSCR